MDLPYFKYHPDPISTGSIVVSDRMCECCGMVRGYVNRGPLYCSKKPSNYICPWCIADGSAHEKLGAEFVEPTGIGGYGDWPDVSQEVKDILALRTPGFFGWQQEKWWTHCDDACAFLGHAGRAEILAFGEDLQEYLREEAKMDGEGWSLFLEALDKGDSPTAYVFRCLHCGKLGGYSDFD